MSARFDDLRPHRRRSFRLDNPIDVFEAATVAEVPEVIAAAESAVRTGRWVAGFVSYEAAPAFDDALTVIDPAGSSVADLPFAWFATFDRRRPTADQPGGGYRLGAWEPTVDEDGYTAAIGAIRDHIRQGDTYQVNHTFRLEADFEGDTSHLYRDLARSQTCGYGSYVDTGRWVVASASPELFFEWSEGSLRSRPMKGTTRRGTSLGDDEQRRRFLLGSEKNRAENLMIVDMVRNDMGRISRLGTVRVPELFTIEKYDTVWQMTSTVTSETEPGTCLVDVFSALFPCASITGAPKVATMRIISDLERTPRGIYCGTVGFGGPGPTGPEWAFNVAIRTVLVDRLRGRAIYGTGGGITYDSTPGDEYAEALLKAEVLERRSADLGLVETMRWEPATGFHRLERHLARLSASAWYFDVPLDPAEVRSALHRATRGSESGLTVRLVVDRAGWVEVATRPLPPRAEPVRLVVDTGRVDPKDPLLHHKTTNRRPYEEARARHPGADDVLLVNTDGHITETTIGNVAVELGGRWYTPPTSDGLLAGTLRQELIERGELSERSIPLEEATNAAGIARLNSVRGWEPAELAGHL